MSLRYLATSLGLAVFLASSGAVSAQTTKVAAPKAKGKAVEAAKKTDQPEIKTETAVFGGGCFWCMEAIFERIPGVVNVVSGYAGGTAKRPTYQMVQTGVTGHAEVIQVTFDPEKLKYDELLEVFWACHDPTTLNQQGPDFGTEYRSIILYNSEDQKNAARKSMEKLATSGTYADPIVTELVPLKAFYTAERYHQNYFRNNRNKPYCQMEVAPRIAETMRRLNAARRAP